ncbi:MAG TPA: branched-chain amino acid ABC transporter permease [Actinomycetes bacterium]|nr:branched-chain amino acid ABC transporter permease [Actinomycetes bacterium]
MSNFFTNFAASTIDGLTQGSIYALVALGYTLVYGVLRLINFAHSEIFMIGTFATVGVITALGISTPLSGIALVGFLLLAAVVAASASGVSAVILERVAYRPLRRRGATTLAALISAIGASLFLQQLVSLRFPDTLSTTRVMNKTIYATIGTGLIRADKVLVFFGSIFMMLLLDRLVRSTRFGRAIRATAQSADTATLMGVNIDRVVMLTFLIGGAMAGIGGMLYVIFFEATSFFVGFVLGIKAFTAAVLGGIGNLRGALLGGLLLGLIQEYVGSVLGAQWKDVVAFAVLVLVLMFRPTGLLGESLSKARA